MCKENAGTTLWCLTQLNLFRLKFKPIIFRVRNEIYVALSQLGVRGYPLVSSERVNGFNDPCY